MIFEEHNIYHIYNRGNNKQVIFFNHKNYLFFQQKIKKELTPYCSILAYCLMPNHFHFMIYTKKEGCQLLNETETRPTTLSGQTSSKKMQVLTRKIGTLLSSYTRAINIEQNRTGSLFQQKTKAKSLLNTDQNYPKVCFHCIHQNPLKAKLVDKIEDWEYSSFRDYTSFRKGKLPDIKLCRELVRISENQQELYKESYDVTSDKLIQLLTI